MPIYDFLDVHGTPILVMPFVEGRDLGRILADRRATLDGQPPEGRHPAADLDPAAYLGYVLPLLEQAIEAVATCHGQKVLHRDIKPPNLLVDPRGNIHLTDFGLARLGDDNSLTLAGQGMGSYGYMSPEQWEGTHDVDLRADVFGLGATLYHALTLSLPYGRHRVVLRTPPAPPASARAPGLPSGLDGVLAKALEPDRHDRYPSAIELLEDWRRVLAGGKAPPRPRFRLARLARHRPWAVAAVLAIAALAGSLAWSLWPSPGPDAPQRVSVATDPAGGRLAVDAIDPLTGEPVGKPRFPDASRGDRLWLPPGDYLVEAAWPGGRFQHVRRHVPRQGEAPGSPYNHSSWLPDGGGGVLWVPVERPPEGVEAGMARLDGTDRFVPPAALGLDATPRKVPAFYLDRAEATIADWGRHNSPSYLPDELRSADPGGPIRSIPWDQAMHFAELEGKTLPSEAQLLYAQTQVGANTEPGARPASPIRGLLSGVGELTTTHASTFALVPRSLLPAGQPGSDRGLDLVPGVDPSRVRLALGVARAGLAAEGPTPRPPGRGNLLRLTRDKADPNVGFRCALPARPLYLRPD